MKNKKITKAVLCDIDANGAAQCVLITAERRNQYEPFLRMDLYEQP